jgi:hypothetical protein
MPKQGWGALLPEIVAEWINFDRDNPDWNYEGKASTSMASRQAEGVAYLWNLLSLNGVALLADEVGMGKTFQALGVAALLWKMKPDAKVLVMAPNRDICAHWRREYSAFVRFHYRSTDHCVKNGADGSPVQSIQSCWRLEDLAKAVEAEAGHLYLTTIHALSGLVPQAEKGSDNNAKAKAGARKVHQRIKRALGEKGFDLIIVDEAHYFRNRNGGSQRVHAAEAFFGDTSDPLADKALLLTATPSHTHLNDVGNILSYFLDMGRVADHSALALMSRYALRRFRRMRGREGDHTKREYRCEKELPCDFRERPASEMFFALYQKKLVTEMQLTRDNKSLLYGFLEGFESVGRFAPGKETGAEAEVDSDDSGRDFTKAKDTELLARLTAQYFSTFGRLPDHPKYGQLVEQCLPSDLFDAPQSLHEDKHLVFVRRIPSVRELTQRINEAYDTILATRIYESWGLNADDPAVKKWRDQGWSRSGFDELVRNRQSAQQGQDDEFDEEELPGINEEEDAYLGSRIADLFVVKKGKDGRTDGSNVSLRFRKPESAFAMFLEPSSDYLTEGYLDYYEYTQGGKSRADYVNAARDERLRRHDLFVQKTESAHRVYTTKRYTREVCTIWALILPELSAEQQGKMRDWAKNRPDVAENFSNYIKTGFLFASPVMVELYAWFTTFNRESRAADVQDKYAHFMAFVASRIRNSLLLSYFKSALDTFEILCEKIIDHKLGEWEKDWRALTSLQNPAWYASGQSGNRQRLILGFNSPFYPNVLVATSVFQEGVNLHLQCRKVHHYGIAGSPGDNEQRVGRVDRLFGKVNELLRVEGAAELEINYPFLKSSVDEDQVASFIARKFHVEEKMDSCIQDSFDRAVELTRENWREFLRTPVKSFVVRDPYVATFNKANLPSFSYTPFENHDNSDIANHIVALLGEILDPATDRLFAVSKNQHNPNAMLLIDPVVDRENGRRRQPILVAKHFSAVFSALVSGTVYYVSLTSPLASKDDLGSIEAEFSGKLAWLGHEFAARYPLARMVIDPDAGRSHFYLHCRVDLPVFVERGNLSMLSRDELSMAVGQLKGFSDRLEYELFSGQRDLAVADLQLADFLRESESGIEKNHFFHPVTKHGRRWERISSTSGFIERLTGFVEQKALDTKYFVESGQKKGDTPVFRALMLNHQFPFLKFCPANNGLVQADICYPSGDIQVEERLLLERWFDYVLPGITEVANRDERSPVELLDT